LALRRCSPGGFQARFRADRPVMPRAWCGWCVAPNTIGRYRSLNDVFPWVGQRKFLENSNRDSPWEPAHQKAESTTLERGVDGLEWPNHPEEPAPSSGDRRRTMISLPRTCATSGGLSRSPSGSASQKKFGRSTGRRLPNRITDALACRIGRFQTTFCDWGISIRLKSPRCAGSIMAGLLAVVPTAVSEGSWSCGWEGEWSLRGRGCGGETVVA